MEDWRAAASMRLLADEHVSGMVNGFLDSWLRLREIGSRARLQMERLFGAKVFLGAGIDFVIH